MPGARSTLPFKSRGTHAILFSARVDEISAIYLNSINFRNVGMATLHSIEAELLNIPPGLSSVLRICSNTHHTPNTLRWRVLS
jgi:hypothetical protein